MGHVSSERPRPGGFHGDVRGWEAASEKRPTPEHHAGTELAFCLSHPAAEGVTRLAGGNEGDSQQPCGQMTQVQAEESSQHTPCSRRDEQAVP